MGSFDAVLLLKLADASARILEQRHEMDELDARIADVRNETSNWEASNASAADELVAASRELGETQAEEAILSKACVAASFKASEAQKKAQIALELCRNTAQDLVAKSRSSREAFTLCRVALVQKSQSLMEDQLSAELSLGDAGVINGQLEQMKALAERLMSSVASTRARHNELETKVIQEVCNQAEETELAKKKQADDEMRLVELQARRKQLQIQLDQMRGYDDMWPPFEAPAELPQELPKLSSNEDMLLPMFSEMLGDFDVMAAFNKTNSLR